MTTVVGVVFRPAGKVYYFDPYGLDLEVGDRVIAKTSRGMELGRVVMPPTDVPDEEIEQKLKKVLRKANPDDLAKREELEEKAKKAKEVCREKIKEHGLDMKLVDAEYVFDGSKIIFFFTAEQRVDFRKLVKDLASTLKRRIELRQIGVRDEAKIKGGLGPCGQRLCCSVFQSEFSPVSIRMAKEQDLPLNPTKISGVCGRLMCCLRYEYEAYKDFKKHAPKKGDWLDTPKGRGQVIEYNVPKETVTLKMEDGLKTELSLSEALSCKKCRRERAEKKA